MKNKPNRAFKDSRNAPKKGRPEPKPRRRDDAEKEMPENEDFVMGRHPVLELLRSDRDVNKLFIQDGLGGEKLGDIIKLAKDRKIQIQAVPKSKLDTLSDNAVHQGVIAATAAFQYAVLDDLFEAAAAKNEDPFFIILDGVEDPHNLGSVLRTADACGAHGVIIPKRRAVGLTATVAKASTGAIEHVPVVRVTNLHRTIEELKERGVWIYATDMSGQDYRQWDTTLPLAMIIGNEGKGISRLLKESADGLLTIPMVGHVQSLNAGVAAGLMMYEVFRKRHV